MHCGILILSEPAIAYVGAHLCCWYHESLLKENFNRHGVEFYSVRPTQMATILHMALSSLFCVTIVFIHIELTYGLIDIKPPSVQNGLASNRISAIIWKITQGLPSILTHICVTRPQGVEKASFWYSLICSVDTLSYGVWVNGKRHGKTTCTCLYLRKESHGQPKQPYSQEAPSQDG